MCRNWWKWKFSNPSSRFATDRQAMLSVLGSSRHPSGLKQTKDVLRNASWMTGMTDKNSNMLAKIGITIFLLSASEAGLNKINKMYVPEQLQAGFSDMIDEYVHFNESARNSIMERMTPDYMVVGIGSKTETYKYKSEIISDERAFYTNEKTEMTGLCDKFLNDEIDKDSFYDGLKGYLNHYYENRYELRNQPGSVREKSNDMLDKLKHMFGV